LQVLRNIELSEYLKAAIFTLFLLLIAVVPFIIFGKSILKPIRLLIQAFQKVTQGDLNTLVSLKSKNELQITLDTFNEMVQGLREPEKFKSTVERREVSILFADVRHFTLYAESHSPEEVVGALNYYFSHMIELVFKYEGTLDKFIGDCVMGVFGTPLNQPDHAERAVRCAWDMQQILNGLNKERVTRNEFPIKIGIGINSGEVISGNIGTEKRMEFAVIGEAVSLASRFEDLAKEGQILIGSSTLEKVKYIVQAQALAREKMRGYEEPVALYEITGLTKK